MYEIAQIDRGDMVENVVGQRLSLWPYPTFALNPRKVAELFQDQTRKYVLLLKIAIWSRGGPASLFS